MHSSEDLTEEFHTYFEDWDVPPIQVDYSDEIKSVDLNHPDEAYAIMCDMDIPKFYSLSKEQDCCKTWYIFRYVEE